MTAANLFSRTGSVRVKKIAGKKVALVPLGTWTDIEEYFEDIAILESRHLAAKVMKAREDIKKGAIPRWKK